MCVRNSRESKRSPQLSPPPERQRDGNSSVITKTASSTMGEGRRKIAKESRRKGKRERERRIHRQRERNLGQEEGQWWGRGGRELIHRAQLLTAMEQS